MNTPSHQVTYQFSFFCCHTEIVIDFNRMVCNCVVLCVVCLVSMLAAWWYVDEESMFQASAVL